MTENSKLTKLAIHGGNPLRKSKMPARRAFGEDEIKELMGALEHFRKNDEDPPYQGPYEEKYCQAFSDYMGGGYSDAVSTGTAAVYVALAALDLPKNSEVLISPVTDSGPLNCIIMQGHTPAVVDSAPNSYNTGVKEFLDRITPRTKAFLAVHSAGEPLEIDQIVSEAKKRDIRVLEDCSQAPGALCNGAKVGSFGDIAAFSTMYRKTLVAGSSGGLVFTPHRDLHLKALGHADRGKPVWRTDIDLRDPGHAAFPALNFNTDDLSCAIGLASLRRLDSSVKKRTDFVFRLIELMNERSIATKPYRFHTGFSPFYFPIFVETEKLSCSKIEFAQALQAEGIGLGVHYGCLISSWKWAKEYLSDGFTTPNAVSTRDRSFNLYVNERYGEAEADDISKAIAKVEKHFLV